MATITQSVSGSNLARTTMSPAKVKSGQVQQAATPVSHSADSVAFKAHHSAPFLKPEAFNAHGLSVEATDTHQLREAGQSLHYQGADYPNTLREIVRRYRREPLPEAYTGGMLEHLESITKKLYDGVKRFRRLPQAEQHQSIEKMAESGDKLLAVVQKMATPLSRISEEKSGQIIRRFATISPELLHKIESAEDFEKMAQKLKETPMGRASDAELGRAIRNLMKLPGAYAQGMQKVYTHELKQFEQRNPELVKLLKEQDKSHKVWLIRNKDHGVAGSLLLTNLNIIPRAKPGHASVNETPKNPLQSHVLASVGLPAKLSKQADIASAVIDNFIHHAKQMNKSDLWIAAPVQSSFHDHLLDKVGAKSIRAQDIQHYLPKASVDAVQAYLSSTNLMNIKLYHVKL